MSTTSGALARTRDALLLLVTCAASCSVDAQSQTETLRAARMKLPPRERVMSVARFVLEEKDADPRDAWVKYCTEMRAAFGAGAETNELLPGAEFRLAVPGGDEFTRNMREFLRRLTEATDELSRVSVQMVNGTKTFDYPDCVGIGDGQRICCSGVLVAPNLVVSAGHCLDHKGGCPVDSAHRAVFFAPTESNQGGEWIGVRAASANVNRPKDYRGDPAYERDLLVLVLDKQAPAEPAKILPDSNLGEVSSVTLVGFGATNVAGTVGVGTKRAATVPVIRKICQPADSGSLNCHSDYELVASNEPVQIKNALGACFGDSGGPAYVELVRNGKPVRYVVGAISRGTLKQLLNTACGGGTICVRLAPFEPWIFSFL